MVKLRKDEQTQQFEAQNWDLDDERELAVGIDCRDTSDQERQFKSPENEGRLAEMGGCPTAVTKAQVQSIEAL
ncbi:hypothetical protein ACJX0J_033761, partial [Zea mays]